MQRRTQNKRSILVRSIAGLLLGACWESSHLYAADATWTGAGNQTFGTAIWGGVGNWSPSGSPSGAGSVISFTSTFTNGPSVGINVNPTIGSVIFTNNTGNPTNDTFVFRKQSATVNNLTLNNTLSGVTSSPIFNITQSTGTLRIETNLLGTGGFTKTGPGKLLLSTNTTTNTAVNTISGTVVVSAGTLGLNQSLAIQNCLLDTTNSVAGDATNGLSTNQTALTIGGLTGNKNFASLFTTTSGGLSGLANLTLNPASGVTGTYTGNIADGAVGMNLIKSGAGTQILSGTNTYTGTTTITAGTLQVAASTALPGYNVANAVTLNGGTLIVNAGGSGWTTGEIDTLLSNAVKTSGTFGIDTTNGNLAQWTPFTTVNIGSGIGFTKAGTNTLTLNQANNYNGLTRITGGTLALSGAGTLGDGTGGVTLAGGALNLGGGSHTNAAISITAAPTAGDTIANGSLSGTSYAASNTSGTAIISANLLVNGGAGFAKTGAGTVAFSGTNTYTGPTSIAANGGTLLYSKTASLYNSDAPSWTGANITVASGGTLALGIGGAGEFSLADVTTILTNLSTSGFAAGASIGFDTTNAPGGSITYSNVIADSTSGSLGIAKLGTGTLVLSGDNTNSGATNVSGGTLNLTGNHSGTAGAFTVSSGATLGISNGSYNTGGTFSVGSISGVSTVNQSGGDVSFSGGTQLIVGNVLADGVYNLSGGTFTTAAVANRGIILGVNTGRSGTFNLSGTGVLTIPTGSVLQIGRSENTAATGTTGIYNQSGGTASIGELRMGGSTAGSANNANSTAQLNLSGGVFTATTFTQLSGGNTSSSIINISGTADVTLPDIPTARGTSSTATITFNGGTLKPLAASATFMGGLTNAFIKAGGAKFDTTNGNITVTQALLKDTISAGGGLTKDGSNTLTLTGANTFEGAIVVSNGRLQLDGAAAGALTAGSLNVSTGGTLGFTTGTASTLNLASKPFSMAGTVNFDIGANGINDSLTVGSFTLTDNSAFTFNPISPIPNGGSYTLLTSSTPIVTGGFSLTGQTSGRLTLSPVINTNTITMNSVLFEGIWNQTGGGNWSNGNPSATGGNWTNYKPTVAGDAALFGSAITGPAAINVDTPHVLGFLRFDNANTVTVGNNASSNLTLDNGAAVGVIAVTSGSHVIAENVSLQSDVAVAPATGTTLTVSGSLSGSKSLQMIGGGNLVLTNSNSYSGTTSINAGTLQLSGSGTLNTAGAITIGAGAVFAINSTNTVTQGSEFSTAPISGAGGITQAGSGTTILNAVNTYTGPTVVSGGILQVGGSGQLGAGNYAGAIQIGTGATLQMSSSAAQTLAGTISGGGTLQKDVGTGTLIINGNNTYSGGTLIDAGIVNVTTNSTALGTGAVTFNGGVRLVVDTSLNLANPLVLGANLVASGRGLVEAGTVAGTATVSGPITINNAAAAGGHFAAPTLNTTLHVAGPITSSVPVVSRSGRVRFSGGGTGYTQLNINQDIGSIGANDGIATTALVRGGDSSGAVLDLNGFNQSLSGVAKGSTGSFTIGNSSNLTDSILTLTGASDMEGTFVDVIGAGSRKLSLVKTGPSTVKLRGINSTYSGGTTVTGGILLANNASGSATGTGTVSIGAGATLGGTGSIAGLTTVSGIVAPGDSSIAPLSIGSNVTWNAGGNWLYELDSPGVDLMNPGTSDLLNITGNFTKGTGTIFSFDFSGTGSTGWYKLVDWTGTTSFTSSDFAATNLPGGLGGSFVVDNASSALYVNLVAVVNSEWVGADALWSSASNWNPTAVPNAASATANFLGNGQAAVSIDTAQAVNALNLNSTTTAYTISGPATLSTTGTAPTITVAGTNTATHIISAALNLGNNTTINVNGGTLALNAPTNSVIGTGVTANVGVGATLSLGGAGNALSNGTSTHANVANSGTLLATTAGKRVGDISGSGTTTVTAAGATLTANHIRQSTLNIGAGNTVTVASNGGNSGTSTVTNLNINATGKLDLTNNDLIVDNGNLATLTSKLATGLDINGTYGNGPGITSSAFASNPNFNTVLGIAANVELGYTSFSGQTVDANDILIKYTYYGDADLSGSVDTSTDFDLYITGLTSGGSLGGWLFGDFDYSGTVDSSTDFDLYITGLTTQGGPLLTAGGGGNLVQAVPEPSTFVLGGLALLGFAGVGLRRRRLANQQT